MFEIREEIDFEFLKKHVRESLEEDIGSGDLTTTFTVGPGDSGRGRFVSRETGIIAGLGLLKIVYDLLAEKASARIDYSWKTADGKKIEAGQVIAEVEGPLAILLTGERVALNYLQQLSGVASATGRLVDIAANYDVKIYDTRKTVPHLRLLQKYAVRCGGGCNHRLRLDKAVMIKDNHKQAAGGLTCALQKVDFDAVDEVVVEIHSPAEIDEAVNFDIDVLMLDNIKPDRIKDICKSIPGDLSVELSGGITDSNLEEVCKTGIERVSVGSITHSFHSLDISFGLIDNG
ncbi:MAG: carboxylating nicotinate-nucleotide diphosphorylase [bacterium]